MVGKSTNRLGSISSRLPKNRRAPGRGALPPAPLLERAIGKLEQV
jgi:hypothetical protein